MEKDGIEEVLIMEGDYTANWTPTKAGIYNIKYIVKDSYGLTASNEIQYLIGSDTTAYILYNNNAWDKAYIHYQVGNGMWTEVPGVKMLDCDVEGYPWIYLVDLGKECGTVCFNNGNGSWDSKNGSNYPVGVGTYGIKNGVQKNLEEVDTESQVTVYYNTGWSQPYIHYCLENGTWTSI